MADSKIPAYNPFVYHGTLGSGDDLNNIKGRDKVGMYSITSNVSNAPSGGNWSILLSFVFGSGQQIVITHNAIMARAYTGSPLAWTAWKRILFSEY